MKAGVFINKKKNGEIYFRSAITYLGKKISLGSFKTENDANKAYLLANEILLEKKYLIEDYNDNDFILTFEKWVVLINYRDNKIYFKTPIYLKNNYFIYYLNKNIELKFDKDDLFYYSTHKIMKRGNHLFVADYGMQINILSRYGIKNFSVVGKDFLFMNGDNYDFRYHNIKVINRYYGVCKDIIKGKEIFISKIHINGDFIIGKYSTENEAGIAYNKAVDVLRKNGIKKNYVKNYIYDISEIEYAKIYTNIRISKKVRQYGIKL